MMITKTIDVKRRLVNGTVELCQRLKLKNDYSNVFMINIGDYNINCVETKNVEYIELELDDKLVRIKPEERIATAQIPHLEAGCTIKHDTERVFCNIKLNQFPAIGCNAMIVHKLQGKSMDCMVDSEWCFTQQNWIYVLLSRLRTSIGLYIQNMLIKDKCKPLTEKCRSCDKISGI